MKSHPLLGGIAAALLLGLGISHTAQASIETKAAKAANITLFGKSEGDKCSFTLVKGKQYTMSSLSSRGCKNDRYYTFQITGGQPGTSVVFMDHPQCAHSQPTYSYLIVGDEEGVLNMTEKRDLAHDGSSGKYLEPHLETYGAPKTGRLGGKLSCVAAWSE